MPQISRAYSSIVRSDEKPPECATFIAAERAHWVHTIDREKIARRLSDQRPETMPPLQVLIEVNIGGEDVKHGVPPQEETLRELAFQVASLPPAGKAAR